MSISLRVNDEEKAAIKSYAALHGISVSDAVRAAILGKIEDELDIKLYDQAMKAHEKDNTTYTHEDVLRELGYEI